MGELIQNNSLHYGLGCCIGNETSQTSDNIITLRGDHFYGRGAYFAQDLGIGARRELPNFIA